ncbi:MAG: hypothetical protein U5N27_00560 [Rhizobium sp.]|nr:hypothetical protein [Rhizobium sp.]
MPIMTATKPASQPEAEPGFVAVAGDEAGSPVPEKFSESQDCWMQPAFGAGLAFSNGFACSLALFDFLGDEDFPGLVAVAGFAVEFGELLVGLGVELAVRRRHPS